MGDPAGVCECVLADWFCRPPYVKEDGGGYEAAGTEDGE